MLENGVAGFLTKDEVPKLLFRAVRGVARGELGWVSSRVSDRIKTFDPNVDSRHMTLTSHEVEVLRLLAGKRTPQEIADTLGLSEDNLNKHLSLLTEKFNAKSPVDLVVLARQAKVI
jgi:DNA-binding NarL/FixJ family response regulator